MGVCFSAQAKAETPYHSGFNPKDDSTDVSKTDCLSLGKVSSQTVIPTLCSEGEILQASNLKKFNLADLKLATRDFSRDNVLGEVGDGSVFKGWVDEQTLAASKPGASMAVAVKRLNNRSSHGHKEWLAQIRFLAQLYHPNLVKMVGYCLEDEERFLVNEFIPRGSLENHLFRRGSYFQPLSWNLRLKVAVGAAKGLAFLHSQEVNVIYCEFKTSSILLDFNYNAKLSDFGLAKDETTFAISHFTSCDSRIRYAAPEYISTGHLTAKGNVYSFGVVLLEMLSGRRAVDKNRPSREISLINWAKPYLADRRKVSRVLDNRLQGQYTLDSAHKVATLALRCLSTEAKFRPTMDQVFQILEALHDPREPSPACTKPTRRRNTDNFAQTQSTNTLLIRSTLSL